MEGSSRVQYNPKQNSVSFFDNATGVAQFIYATPSIQLLNNETSNLTLDWDPSLSSLVISLPEVCTPPFVLKLDLELKYVKWESHRIFLVILAIVLGRDMRAMEGGKDHG